MTQTIEQTDVDKALDCMAESDALYWAVRFGIRLSSGQFSLKGHEYQMEPMQCDARRQVYLKATGGGFSEIKVLETIHGLIYGRYKQGVLYLFPTNEDVLDFSSARFKSLVEGNPATVGKYVKTGSKGTDKASLKRIGQGFLYLRGARLTQAIEEGFDEKEASKLRGIQVDRVVFDEMGLMDESAIAKAKGRMGHSQIKEEVYISNPGIPGDALDTLFVESDQRHWMRKCKCGRWFSADEEFPECVHVRPNGTGYIGCKKCGAEVPFWQGEGTGEYVARNRGSTSGMAGYHWSHLTSNFNDPAEVLRDFLEPPQGNLSDVYRLRLGRSHISEADKLTQGMVRECMGQDVMATSHVGPCAMGVDVGISKHYVIGARTGNEVYRIVKVGTVSDWNDLHDLAQKFNVKSAVIDSMPDIDAVRAFQKSETYPIFLNQYSETTLSDVSWDDGRKVVVVNRTQAMDASHRIIAEKKITLPRRCPEMDTFAIQVTNPAKILETNKRTNQQIYRYRGSNDHYRHALNYFMLAARRVPQVQSYLGSSIRPKAKTQYAII